MRRERKSPMHFLVAAAVLPALSALTAPGLCAAEEIERSEAAKHSARAAEATQQRDFAQAELEWRKVLELDPRSAQAYNNLGMVYYLEHKYPEAEQALGRALQLDPSLANGKVLLGATLVRQGKMERAIPELERALKSRLSDSAEKTARVSLHEAWFARESYAKALEVLKPLAEKYPRDVDVLYSLGQTHLQLASQRFREIANVDPQSYRVHQILADALAKQGRHRDAVLEYRRALEQKPDLPGIHYQIGLLYRTYENNPASDEAALREFEAELKINPYDAWSEYRLGRVYWKRRDLEGAVAHFRRAIQLDEALVPARLALARTLETQGNLKEAQEHLELAGKYEPENASVHYRLANLCKKRGNVDEAAVEMKKFEQIQTRQQGVQQELEKTLRMTTEPDTEAVDEQDP